MSSDFGSYADFEILKPQLGLKSRPEPIGILQYQNSRSLSHHLNEEVNSSARKGPTKITFRTSGLQSNLYGSMKLDGIQYQPNTMVNKKYQSLLDPSTKNDSAIKYGGIKTALPSSRVKQPYLLSSS